MLTKRQIQNYVNTRIKRRAAFDSELYNLDESNPKKIKLRKKIDQINNELLEKATDIGESYWNCSIYDDSNIEMTTVYGSMDYESIIGSS